MNLLKSKVNLLQNLKELIVSANYDIIVFSPYIKNNALIELLGELKKGIKVTVITTWKPADIAFGSSDLSVFEYCKKNNYQLLINNRIHLKAIFVDHFSNGYIGSANVTNSGLAINNNYNYEIGSIIQNMTEEDLLYFDQIIEGSFAVDDSYYDKIILEASKLQKPHFPKSFGALKENNFLLTSLPMSTNTNKFYKFYQEIQKSGNIKVENLRCMEHDKRLYKIQDGLSQMEFYNVLESEFFSHPFVVEYLEFNGDGRNFGQLSNWLHQKVTTIPTPRRYDIKKIQQNLNNFIVSLSHGSYKLISPNHSQILKKVK
jgi:hypothetical protein